MKKRMFLYVVVIIGCLAFITGLWKYLSQEITSANINGKPEIDGFLWPNPRIIEPFYVKNQQNQPFGLEQLNGKWSFLFFGFTNCPDICPYTLSLLNQVHKKLALQNQTNTIQVIFVTVDPERDTVEQINDYINYFNRNFIGLTGTGEQIASLAKQMGVVYMKDHDSPDGEYLVDHSASIFLISPSAQWVGLFTSPHNIDDIVSRFNAIQGFINKHNL